MQSACNQPSQLTSLLWGDAVWGEAVWGEAVWGEISCGEMPCGEMPCGERSAVGRYLRRDAGVDCKGAEQF